jgi:shikimate kinase
MRSNTVSGNIFLVGPMGSGKSAVGRHLAKILRLPFLDSDTEIENRTGVDIPFIFEKEGEAGFRRREEEVIEALTGQAGVVLATGGGAILIDQNRKFLGARGTVVYLHATVEQQEKRTRRGRERPLLQGGDRSQILQELMQIRDPLYRGIADIIVETDGRSVSAVTTDIRERLLGSD